MTYVVAGILFFSLGFQPLAILLAPGLQHRIRVEARASSPSAVEAEVFAAQVGAAHGPVGNTAGKASHIDVAFQTSDIHAGAPVLTRQQIGAGLEAGDAAFA